MSVHTLGNGFTLCKARMGLNLTRHFCAIRIFKTPILSKPDYNAMLSWANLLNALATVGMQTMSKDGYGFVWIDEPNSEQLLI